MSPQISDHYLNRQPSAIRQAQITFAQRPDKESVQVVNLAIGNVSLPMHPAMQQRMHELGTARLKDGVVKYTPSMGTDEALAALLNIIGCEGADTKALHCLITDGGSQAMELMMLGVCGPNSARPLLLLDPVYTNYIDFGKRISIQTLTVNRHIDSEGNFAALDLETIERTIIDENPSALLVIPADNPTGQLLKQSQLNEIARLCVKYGMWLVSDEAYRQLYYNDHGSSSIWCIKENEVPGIFGSRISIESTSKVWNACGLRIGGLVTDNLQFYQKTVSEYTANLCANTIGQEIFGVLAHETHEALNQWYEEQRNYYRSLILPLRINILEAVPGLIITKPEAAIYFIIDFKHICSDAFDARDFVHYCAAKGKVNIQGKDYTLLLAPMGGFYKNSDNGKTQLRVAIVEPKELIEKTPVLLSELYKAYTA